MQNLVLRAPRVAFCILVLVLQTVLSMRLT